MCDGGFDPSFFVAADRYCFLCSWVADQEVVFFPIRSPDLQARATNRPLATGEDTIQTCDIVDI